MGAQRPKEELYFANFKQFQQDSLLKPITGPAPQSAPGIATPFKVLGGGDVNKSDRVIPLDNNSAAGQDGWLITATNGVLEMRKNGALKFMKSFEAFLNDLIPFPCDPKVIYDEHRQRFIVFGQRNAGQRHTSEIVIGMTKGRDPMEGWHFYVLTGNPDQRPGEWFDYPKLAVTETDVFLTGNIYNRDDTFQRSAIYQLSKLDMLDGLPVRHRIWRGLEGDPATLQPAPTVSPQAGGPGMYFLSTRYNNPSSVIDLYLVTNGVSEERAEILHWEVAVEPYRFFAKAVQPQGERIDNGDIRMQDALLLGDRIYYTYTSGDRNRYSRVNLNALELPSLKNSSLLIGATPDMSYAFPSLHLLRHPVGAPHLILQFNHVGTNAFPGISACACTLEPPFTCSQEVVLKKGEAVLSGERWGDYTSVAACTTCNDVLFATASYAHASGNRRSYVTQLAPLGSPTAYLEMAAPEARPFAFRLGANTYDTFLSITNKQGLSQDLFIGTVKGNVNVDLYLPSTVVGNAASLDLIDKFTERSIKSYTF